MGAADAEAAQGPIDILDLATLIVTASRLIGGLANLPLFKTAGVSVPEWLALSVLADKEGISNKILARSLGVTGQRANQLCTSLSEADLISITDAEDDSRRNVIRITDTGKKRLGELNSQLRDLFAEALRAKRRSWAVTGKHMRLMMRIVQAGTPEVAARRTKRREKKKGEKDGTSDARSRR